MAKVAPFPSRRLDVVPALMAVAIILPFAAAPLVRQSHLIPLVILLATLTVAAVVVRSLAVFRLGLYCTALVACLISSSLCAAWPLPLLLALALYALLAATIPDLRLVGDWFRRGRFTPPTLILIIGSLVLVSIMLILWRPAVASAFAGVRLRLPQHGVALPAIAILFVLTSAAADELAFRGVILSSLQETWGANAVSLLVQAVAFALYYPYTLPHSFTGMSFIFIYGVLLGLIRRRSSGLLAPWITHVLVDLLLLMALLR